MILTKEQKSDLKESIDHWKKDIIKWFEGGYIIDESTYDKATGDSFWCDGTLVEMGSDECKLCTVYFVVDEDGDGTCTTCPLHINGFNCYIGASPYRQFLRNPTFENARKMVSKMEYILND